MNTCHWFTYLLENNFFPRLLSLSEGSYHDPLWKQSRVRKPVTSPMTNTSPNSRLNGAKGCLYIEPLCPGGGAVLAQEWWREVRSVSKVMWSTTESPQQTHLQFILESQLLQIFILSLIQWMEVSLHKERDVLHGSHPHSCEGKDADKGKTLSLKSETNQKPKYLGSDWYKEGEFKEFFLEGPIPHICPHTDKGHSGKCPLDSREDTVRGCPPHLKLHR